MGTVAGIFRYPVKSMQGEEIEAGELVEVGLAGDRVYALQEVETGFIVSAKHPRKWEKVFECSARYLPSFDQGTIEITLPSGRMVHSDDPDINRQISEAIGREVRLVRASEGRHVREANRASPEASPGEEDIREETMGRATPPGSFVDFAPIHVITTGTLKRFRELYPAGDFAASRFRPNVLVATDDIGFVEDAWLGKTLCVGSVETFVFDPSVRCIVTTLALGELPRDPQILRTVALHHSAPSYTEAPGTMLRAIAGVYLRILSGGTIRKNDGVSVRG